MLKRISQKLKWNLANRWSNKKVAIVSVAIFIASFAWTELIWGSYTIISSYLVGNYDHSTQGKVVLSDRHVERGWSRGTSETVNYRILYTYSVEGVPYEGKLVNFETTSTYVDEILGTYPEGKEVTVYYDKNNPEYSVLEVSGLGWGLIGNILIIAFAIPFVTFILSR